MSKAEDEVNEQYKDKPILSVEENLERMRKIKEKRLEAEDKTTEQDKVHSKEGSLMPNIELPKYPFTEGGQTKKKAGEPQKAPWE